MRLYVMPGSCALACHIALEWAAADYELEVHAPEALRGLAYLVVNPKGQVPALMLDNGAVVTDALAVLLLVADLFPTARLALLVSGAPGRTRLHEALSELVSEAYPAFAPLFAPGRHAAEPGCETRPNRQRWREWTPASPGSIRRSTGGTG